MTIARDAAAATEAIAQHLRLTAEIIVGSPILQTQDDGRRERAM